MHLFIAPNIAEAALIRFSTSASDVSELVLNDPKYSNSLVKWMKPFPSRLNLSVFLASYEESPLWAASDVNRSSKDLDDISGSET